MGKKKGYEQGILIMLYMVIDNERMKEIVNTSCYRNAPKLTDDGLEVAGSSDATGAVGTAAGAEAL